MRVTFATCGAGTMSLHTNYTTLFQKIRLIKRRKLEQKSLETHQRGEEANFTAAMQELVFVIDSRVLYSSSAHGLAAGSQAVQ